MRTCVACREEKPKRELIRVVLLPEGGIAIDESGKRSGRGAYLCRQRLCWQEALRRESLSRALRSSLSSEDIALLRDYAESLPEKPEEA